MATRLFAARWIGNQFKAVSCTLGWDRIPVINKLWHDPVWSKVIAAGILGILALGTRFDWWSSSLNEIRRAARWLMAFLVTRSALPHWLIALGVCSMLILAILIVIGIVVAAQSALGVSPEQRFVKIDRPAWISYTMDVFYDVRWRWTYGNSAEIENVLPFCPRCDYQLTIRNISNIPIVDVLAFHCDLCNRDVATIQEPLSSITSKVTRFIHQKLRTETWPRSGREIEEARDHT